MARKRRSEAQVEELVMIVPGGQVMGRAAAEAWLRNEREAALARAQQPGADVLGCLARALTCSRALAQLPEAGRFDFVNFPPATVADVLEVFRQA